MYEQIVNQCAASIDEFRKILPVKWFPRTILLSEGFAFLAMCDFLSIDLIIESGVYEGRSTNIWAAYRSCSLEVVSIDQVLRKATIERLSEYENLRFVQGEATETLPKLLDTNDAKRIAVFIDGPKGAAAIDLGLTALLRPNVYMVGIHDVHKLSKGKINSTRTMLDSHNPVFYTDEAWFVQKYSFLDENESNFDEEQEVRWVPYELKVATGRKERKLGSYGPTIGFLLSSPPDNI